MKVIVTGAAGFIGSNIVKGLNARGVTDVIAVDNLRNAAKFANLIDTQVSDYLEKDDFLPRLTRGDFGRIDAIFHEGACSDTMEHDGHYMIENNFRYSKVMLDHCVATDTPLLYASSAATYGGSSVFVPEPAYERPLNVYGFSKLLFDRIVRQVLPATRTQVAGFRYFNVYGPGEAHKGRMASVAFHHSNQWRDEGVVKLFGANDGVAAGEQSRDFVFVDDVVAVNLWFLEHRDVRGIFNLGTGRAQPFNDIARTVVNASRAAAGEGEMSLEAMLAAGLVRYIDFPDALKGKYQNYTRADITALREAGYDRAFASVEEGVGRYMQVLRGV